MVKNNVTRFLTAKKIAFEAIESDPVKRSALESAEILGVDPFEVYKSIVVKRVDRGKPIVVVLPGPCTVDLKKVACLVGEKKIMLTTQTEAEKLTGLLTGGISPLALIAKGFQFVLDASIQFRERMIVSGGRRGLSIWMNGSDLISLLDPVVGDVVSDRDR